VWVGVVHQGGRGGTGQPELQQQLAEVVPARTGNANKGHKKRG
jgi:hypothetical protein